MVQGRVEDEAVSLPVVWFNRPWAERQLPPGREYLLFGKVRAGRRGLEMVNPTCEAADGALAGGAQWRRSTPPSPVSEPASVRKLLRHAVRTLELPRGLPDALPAELLERHRLPSLGEALDRLHRPDDGRRSGNASTRAPAGRMRGWSTARCSTSSSK